MYGCLDYLISNYDVTHRFLEQNGQQEVKYDKNT